MTETDLTNRPALIAWQVRDNRSGGKAIWTRVGAAWHHRNGEGLSIQLDTLPLDGRIVLLPPNTATVVDGGAA